MNLSKYQCEGQMNIFDFLSDPEPKKEPSKGKKEEDTSYDSHNPILNHLIEEIKEIFPDIKDITYYVWPWVPYLGKRLTIEIDTLPEEYDTTPIIEKYLKEYQLEVSISPMGFEREDGALVMTLWNTKGHKERTDWKEEPKNNPECGKWIEDHGKRVMFEDIKPNHFYVADYSNYYYKFYKIIFTKWIKDDAVAYVDSPKGINKEFSWSNSFSCMTRQRWINADRNLNAGKGETSGWWYELSEDKEKL